MPQPDSLSALHRLVWLALLAALVAVGAFLHFPVFGVPFTLQPLFVLMAGFILGPTWGMAALLLYVGAGLVGLPVFAGGKSGFAVVLGPTGGYLAGFIICAGLAGLATRGSGGPLPWARGLIFGFLGLAVVYLLGVPRLAMVLKLPTEKALMVGLLPFIVPDMVKLAASVAVYRFLAAKRLLPK